MLSLIKIHMRLRLKPLLLDIERRRLSLLWHLIRVPPQRLPGEVYWARPTWRRPRRADREYAGGDYVSHLVWEHLRISQEELEDGADISRNPDPDKQGGKRIDSVCGVCGIVQLKSPF